MKTKTIAKTIKAKVNDWLATLPEDIQNYVGTKVVITGGCIASMLLKEKVNDYDMYFKNIKAAILVSRHYCNTWIEENKCQKTGKYIKDVIPMLRLTLPDDCKQTRKFLQAVSDEGKDFGKPYHMSTNGLGQTTIAVHPSSQALADKIEAGFGIFSRVEIYVRSQGFLGVNPDEEYDYFESRPPEEADEFISAAMGERSDTEDRTLLAEERNVADDAGDKYRVKFMSSNAITLSHKMQIVIRFFGEPSEIHDTYDFVHATNYWTKAEGLVTNARALEALLARELIYTGSKYPLASIFRTRKFLKRDWTMHIGNYVLMAMQLNEMDLTNVYVLEEQLTGVDAAYLNQIISVAKNTAHENETQNVDSTYIMTLVERMMGGEELDEGVTQ